LLQLFFVSPRLPCLPSSRFFPGRFALGFVVSSIGLFTVNKVNAATEPSLSCGERFGCSTKQPSAVQPPAVQPQVVGMVVQLPFRGAASPDLLADVEDAARAALLARGASGPDRSTVRGALGVMSPADTTSIVNFGRSMGATHVLFGEVTPLTGQFNLTLRLYEVNTSKVAEQSRNVGTGDESSVIPGMLQALFAPGAMQLSPEERQRQLEEQRRQEEAQRRQQEEQRRQQEEQRRQEEARRREEERRRAEEIERRRRIYRFAEGGRWSVGLSGILSGRISGLEQRPVGLPEPSSLVVAARVDGSYAVVPSVGFEVGASILGVFTLTNAVAVAPTARINIPWRGYIPLRGSAGVGVGPYFGTSGSKRITAWITADIRAEYDIVPAFTVYAGLELDSAPGLYGSLGGVLGVRFHFGEPSPNPTSNSSPNSSSGNRSGSSNSSPTSTPTSTPSNTTNTTPTNTNSGDDGWTQVNPSR